MTVSTQPKEKIKKKKGPLRIEAIGTILIIMGLFFLYGKFFFDAHLRKGLEWTGTYIHGAEVNIGSIDSSVFGGSFALKKLQVTDKKKPELNMFEVGLIKFELSWDALFRAKIVIDEASILDIKIQSIRKKPGRVIPEKEFEKKSQALAKLESTVLEQSKEELGGSALGDVAEVLGGTDPKDQIKSIQGELKAEAKIKELESGLKTKEEAWKKKIDGLDHKEQLERVSSKAKAIKVDKKKPWKSIKEYKDVANEAKLVLNDYKKISNELKTDIKTYSTGIASIDNLIKEDMGDIQKRFNIPSLDFKDFSKAIFGKLFKDKVADIYKYMEVAKEYMPPKKDGQHKNELIPHKRGEGVDYKFPIKNGYPLFWLKKGHISSKSSQSEYSGDLEGQVLNITSNPSYLGKPAVITFKGGFPKQKVQGVDVKVVLDHTKEVAVQTLEAKVGSYPVSGKSFSNSEKVKFGIKDAKGQANLNAQITGNQVNINLENWFNSVSYEVEAKNKIVKETLENIVQGIPQFKVRARADGIWSNLNWGISSTLGQQIATGVKGQVQSKINEAKAKAKKLIDDKVGPQKDALMKNYDKLKNSLSSLLDSKSKEMESINDSVSSSSKTQASESSPAPAVKDKAKDLLKGFKKKFKF